MNFDKLKKLQAKTEATEHVKKQFRKESKKVIKLLAEQLSLHAGEYDLVEDVRPVDKEVLSFGSVGLHADAFSILVTNDTDGDIVLYRNQGRKDFSFESPRYFSIDDLDTVNWSDVIKD